MRAINEHNIATWRGHSRWCSVSFTYWCTWLAAGSTKDYGRELCPIIEHMHEV